MEGLLSDKNPLIKKVRRAIQRGTLTDDGFAIAEGRHLLEEALKSKADIGMLIVAESAQNSVLEITKSRKMRIAMLWDADFAALASTESPQGVITLVKAKGMDPGSISAGPSHDRCARWDPGSGERRGRYCAPPKRSGLPGPYF